MSVLADVASRLVAAGLVTAVGTDVFLTRNAVIVSGAGPFLSMVEVPGSQTVRQDGTYPEPVFQVTARAIKASEARTLAIAVYNNLHLQSARNVTINGTFYLWIEPEQPPFEMPADDASRARYSFNVRVMQR